MATPIQVPDKVLSWLWGSLTTFKQYLDANRTYSDIARTLAYQPTITPRTETYTYENGSSALLLLLHGTLPVVFRGNTYRFPISIWIPHAYPSDPPMMFFNPSQAMVIRPGQHVSIEGKIYHPYLAQWRSHWNRSNLLDCLAILQDVFAKEPPMIARAHQAPPQGNEEGNSRLPEATRASSGSYGQSPMPPPKPPPKPTEARSTRTPDISASKETQVTPAAPPRPPKPGQAAAPPTSASRTIPHHVNPLPYPQASSSTGSAIMQYGDQPSSLSRQANHSILTRYGHPHVHPPAMNESTFSPYGATAAHQSQALSDASGRIAQRLATPRFQGEQGLGRVTSPMSAPPKPPIQDLMSMPLELSLPSQASNLSALAPPPIPPNPEKDALLQAISSTLRAQLDQALVQNAAALPALEAQQKSLRQAIHHMQGETYQLEELNQTLARNEIILRDSMHEADRVVEGAKHKELPPIDDVLVAPHTVGEQLYKLVADERSIGDAIFALTKALDKGRIGSEVFVKQTRSLAREQFLQKALIKKTANGMGLMAKASRQ